MFGGGGGLHHLLIARMFQLHWGAWLDANMCGKATPRFLVTILTGYFECYLKRRLSLVYSKFVTQNDARRKQMFLLFFLNKG